MLVLRLVGLLFVALGVALGCGGAIVGGAADGGASSSSTGAGGGAGTDGAGSGGQPGPCTAGTTTFHMRAADGDNSDYCVGLLCSPGWMTITTRDGLPMPISKPCETDCSDCKPVGCPDICAAPRRMKPDGEYLVWDGTFWEASTCNGRSACRQKTCAAPGRYVVSMCASRRISDAGPFCEHSDIVGCPAVEFDYPSATTVEGVLP